MPISIIFDKTPLGGPEYFVQLTPPSVDNARISQDQILRFREMESILTTGPACLGHANKYPKEHRFHVFLSRTHFVGDDGGYSVIGNGDQTLLAKLRDGWKIESCQDVICRTVDQGEVNRIRVTLKKAGESNCALMIPNGDRHAPVIDGIYMTLLLAQNIFEKVTFKVTENAKRFMQEVKLSGSLDAAMVPNPDYSIQEPTYTYLSTLYDSIEECKQREEKVSLVREEVQMSGLSKKVCNTLSAYSLPGKDLLSALDKNYSSQARTLPQIYKCEESFNFMAFYTPLSNSIKECKRRLASFSSLNGPSTRRSSPKRVTLSEKIPTTKPRPIARPHKLPETKQKTSPLRRCWNALCSAWRAFTRFIQRIFSVRC